MRIAASLLCFAALGSALACELVDPLNDLTGGSKTDAGTDVENVDLTQPPAPAPRGADAGAAVDAGKSDAQTTCMTEHEPNDSTANLLFEGDTCGVLAIEDDEDDWRFTAAADGTLTITVDASPLLVVELTSTTGVIRSGNAPQAFTFVVGSGAQVFLSLYSDDPTKEVPYTIHLSRK